MAFFNVVFIHIVYHELVENSFWYQTPLELSRAFLIITSHRLHLRHYLCDKEYCYKNHFKLICLERSHSGPPSAWKGNISETLDLYDRPHIILVSLWEQAKTCSDIHEGVRNCSVKTGLCGAEADWWSSDTETRFCENLCAELRREGDRNLISQPHPDRNCVMITPSLYFTGNLGNFFYNQTNTNNPHTPHTHHISWCFFLFQPTTGLNMGFPSRHTHTHTHSSDNDLLRDTGNILQLLSAHRSSSSSTSLTQNERSVLRENLFKSLNESSSLIHTHRLAETCVER